MSSIFSFSPLAASRLRANRQPVHGWRDCISAELGGLLATACPLDAGLDLLATSWIETSLPIRQDIDQRIRSGGSPVGAANCRLDRSRNQARILRTFRTRPSIALYTHTNTAPPTRPPKKAGIPLIYSFRISTNTRLPFLSRSRKAG